MICPNCDQWLTQVAAGYYCQFCDEHFTLSELVDDDPDTYGDTVYFGLDDDEFGEGEFE